MGRPQSMARSRGKDAGGAAVARVESRANQVAPRWQMTRPWPVLIWAVLGAPPASFGYFFVWDGAHDSP